MKLYTILLLFVVFLAVVDAQRPSFGVTNRNENGPGLLEVLYTNFVNFVNPTKPPRKMSKSSGRILNYHNNRLEMLDEEVITQAPSVAVPSVSGSLNFGIGSIFERIFQIPIATLESIRNMVQTKNRYLSSEG